MLDTRDKLVLWFAKNCHGLKVSMESTSHYGRFKDPHKYHGEGSVWTHTMMVMTVVDMQKFKTLDEKRILLTTALLHDIGKVYTAQTIGDKKTFRGHEGESTFRSMAILNDMEKEDNFYSNVVKNIILKLISRHGTSNSFNGKFMSSLADDFRFADKKGAVRREDVSSGYEPLEVSDRSRVLEPQKQIYFVIGVSDYTRTLYCAKTFPKDFKIITINEKMDDAFDEMLIDAREDNNLVINLSMVNPRQRRDMLNDFPEHHARAIVLFGSEDLSPYYEDRRKRFIMPVDSEGFESIELVFE